MWLGAESNRRHVDFQSTALPTELPSRDDTPTLCGDVGCSLCRNLKTRQHLVTAIYNERRLGRLKAWTLIIVLVVVLVLEGKNRRDIDDDSVNEDEPKLMPNHDQV
jgi:hypothetical protein